MELQIFSVPYGFKTSLCKAVTNALLDLISNKMIYDGV